MEEYSQYTIYVPENLIITESMSDDFILSQLLEYNGFEITDNNITVLAEAINNGTILLEKGILKGIGNALKSGARLLGDNVVKKTLARASVNNSEYKALKNRLDQSIANGEDEELKTKLGELTRKAENKKKRADKVYDKVDRANDKLFNHEEADKENIQRHIETENDLDHIKAKLSKSTEEKGYADEMEDINNRIVHDKVDHHTDLTDTKTAIKNTANNAKEKVKKLLQKKNKGVNGVVDAEPNDDYDDQRQE